jgi:membrane protease YdiL (CAAX protease family)
VSTDTLDRRRLAVFLLVTFGVSWTTAAVVAATGGLQSETTVLPGLPLWLVLVATGYMWGPAVGNVVARLVTDEGWRDLMVRPNLRSSARVYLAVWLTPLPVVAAGAAVFFALFPRYFDVDMGAFGGALAAAGVTADPALLLAVQLAGALTVGAALNTVFAFGEEFGWRAYLLPKLRPAGDVPAVLAHGVVWSVWHWPLIAMGYEYAGLDYWAAPWTGFLAFTPFAVAAGTFLAWATVRTGSVWPAALGHGVINAVAGIGIVFVRPSAPFLLGPGPQGVVGVLPWVALAAVLLRRLSGEPTTPS